jgi:hypothetical protein
MNDPMKAIADAERALAAAHKAAADAQRQHAEAISAAAGNLADLHRQLAAERAPQWSLSDLLLARIEQHLASANWQRDGKKGPNPAPGAEDVTVRLRRLGLLPNPNPDEDGPTAVGVSA